METKALKSFLKGKKAQIGRKIETVIIVIISVVVLFQIFASLVPEAQSAGEEFSDETKCAEAACFFNSTLAPSCVINSSQEGTAACTNKVQIVPLASLFGSSGVIILLLIIVLFIGTIKLVMPKTKK